VHDLHARMRAHHAANLEHARRLAVWTRHEHVGRVIGDLADALAARPAARRVVLGTGFTPTTIAEIDRVLEAAPDCMRAMHTRALAGRGAFRRHLKFEERRVYFAFMASHGVQADTLLVELQAAYPDPAYFKKVVQAAKGGAWARTSVLTGTYKCGTSCPKMLEMGLCSYAAQPSVTHAMAKCQRERARRLDIEDTGGVAGSPYVYTQRTRIALNEARVKVEVESK
ncbi:MAG: hypothetical protein Q7V62_04925, partial [Actinomycetota bacterium]|nr:hypothetical protein [Actinomycetota bacterium]